MTTKNRHRLKRKYFSIEEAQQLLPGVQKLLTRTISLNRVLDLLGSIEIEVYEDDYDNVKRVTKLNKEFHKLSYEFYRNIEVLEDRGCIIKDLELGIVDFLAFHNGREVFLCWKLGEHQIEFYHEIDDGFVGRKPLVNSKRKSN